VTLNVGHGDALEELCAQLTRDMFAIAKFLFSYALHDYVIYLFKFQVYIQIYKLLSHPMDEIITCYAILLYITTQLAVLKSKFLRYFGVLHLIIYWHGRLVGYKRLTATHLSQQLQFSNNSALSVRSASKRHLSAESVSSSHEQPTSAASLGD